jgi:hypothetical protein
VRDGHEPKEAEEQRPCCVPIEPVHVISSPKDRREQEGYQNSGSLGENGWGDFAGVNPLSFARRARRYPLDKSAAWILQRKCVCESPNERRINLRR